MVSIMITKTIRLQEKEKELRKRLIDRINSIPKLYYSNGEIPPELAHRISKIAGQISHDALLYYAFIQGHENPEKLLQAMYNDKKTNPLNQQQMNNNQMQQSDDEPI